SQLAEDTLDCPIVDLQLIAELDNKTYKFQRGSHPSLPDEVFTFALLDFWKTSPLVGKANTLTLEKIAYSAGSPGRIFKLDEDSLVSRLENLERRTVGAFRYDETGGLKQVYKHPQKEMAQLDLLKAY